MIAKNDDARTVEALCKYLSDDKILHKYDADNSEHLYAGDKIHLIRIAAGPRTYWYGGGIKGEDNAGMSKEVLWTALFAKFQEQEKHGTRP